MSTLQKKRRFPAAFGGLTDDWGGFGRISLEVDLAQGHLQGAGGGLQGHLFLLPEFHDHMRIKKTKSARKNNKTAKARLNLDEPLFRPSAFAWLRTSRPPSPRMAGKGQGERFIVKPWL
jgi:hypothetical protein